MKTIHSKYLLSALALVTVLLICSCMDEKNMIKETAETVRPNVLFIAIDDLNDWVGCLGGHPQVKTPHIDRLAKRGMLFTNAHTQSPICNPSRTSVLTGLRPSTTGIYGLSPWVRYVDSLKNLVTMPQYFSQNGYVNYSTGKIYHGGNGRGKNDTEFDVLGPGTDIKPTPEKKLIGTTPGGNHKLMDWGTFDHNDEEKGDWEVASWAVDVLNQKQEKPFFLSVGFFLPHVPIYVTDKWAKMYPDESLVMPPIKADDRDDTPKFSWYNHWDLPEPRLKWLQESGQHRSLVQSYLAAISFVDSQVGRVVEALENNNLDKNTIIVLWSDHGYHLGEKQISGKNTLWERSTHVPLIFSGPGITPNSSYDQPVELLDIFPTLNELCDLNERKDLEGHSLVPQLKNPKASREWPAITTNNYNNHGIRSGDWRYIKYADGSEELYNIKEDPNEWDNLAQDNRFKEKINEFQKWLPTYNHLPHLGNNLRVLQYVDGKAIWEGEIIEPDAAIPGI